MLYHIYKTKCSLEIHKFLLANEIFVNFSVCKTKIKILELDFCLF